MDEMKHENRLLRYAMRSESTMAEHLSEAADYIQKLEAEKANMIDALTRIRSEVQDPHAWNIAFRVLEEIGDE
jgi:hypothetical protein